MRMDGRDRGPARFEPGPDLRATRIVAALRLGVLIAIAATGSFVPHVSGRHEAYFLVIGLIGVPWATVVLFTTDRLGPGLARHAWVGELAGAFALQVLVPERARLALVGSVAIVAVTTMMLRTVAAWTVGGAAIAVALAGQLVSAPEDRVGAGELALYVGVVVAVTLLAERLSGERSRAAAWATHLEGRAATILDNVASAVAMTDLSGVVHTLNPAARRLVGTAPPGAHCGDVLRLHSGERALDCTNGCALLALTTGPGESVQLWRPGPNGRRQPVLANAALVGNPVAEVVHSLRDITKVMEADEAKTLFLATASHELKTPLTVINGFAMTLLRHPDADDETRHTALLAIHQRGQELARIVERLLLSSRIEAGRLSLDLTGVDTVEVVEERVRAVRDATGRDVRLDVRDVPLAWGSADALSTVVDHLLDNGLKYSSDAVDVTVVDDGAAVVVRVADRGIGMSEYEVDHCFDKFWQADATDARAYGGTGIGLYIVKSLVDAMRGDVTVDATQGEGTTFTVRLPVEPVVPAPRDEPTEPSIIREFMRQIGVREG